MTAAIVALRRITLTCVALVIVSSVGSGQRPVEQPAQDPPVKQSPAEVEETANSTSKDSSGADGAQSTGDSKPRFVRLDETHEVWVDPVRKSVIVGGEICLREGQLEMFACPKNTKEHESIVSVNSPARLVHAGLLAVGATVGTPVRFDPEYAPATGTVIDVDVYWEDQEGVRHKRRAQELIKHLPTDKEMQYPFVFAGSGFWVDERTRERHYYADAGEFICVSNFSTALLDLPVKSSQDAGDLLFAAFTERIPPRGTRVHVVLTPRPGGKPAANQEGGSKKDETPEDAAPSNNKEAPRTGSADESTTAESGRRRIVRNSPSGSEGPVSAGVPGPKQA